MSTGQEFNNRSQGQRIRRTNERVTENAAQTAQAQRDIKVLQNRVGYLERQAQRQKSN